MQCHKCQKLMVVSGSLITAYVDKVFHQTTWQCFGCNETVLSSKPQESPEQQWHRINKTPILGIEVA